MRLPSAPEGGANSWRVFLPPLHVEGGPSTQGEARVAASGLEGARGPVLGAAAGGVGDAGELLPLGVLHQLALDAGDETRSLEHEPGVELQERGAGLDLGDGRGTGVD